MCDRLIEDIVSVTESLMVAGDVELKAYAHPDAKLSVNEKIRRASMGLKGHSGHAQQDKLAMLKDKMAEHQAGEGVFKRGTC